MQTPLRVQICCWALIAPCLAAAAETATPFDAAQAFGSRPSVSEVRLSPDAKSVLYLAPMGARGAVAYTLSLAKGSVPQRALASDGKGYRIDECRWVSNDRVVCLVDFNKKDPTYGIMQATRWFAVNRDGSNLKELSTQTSDYSVGYNLYGGTVIDWLPDEDGAVLMTRNYIPEQRQNTRMMAEADGLGVDRIDTRTLAVKHVESAHRNAEAYLSDGRGNVRIMVTGSHHKGDDDTGLHTTLYRLQGSREWRTLGTYNELDHSGFSPRAVDHELNVVYGIKRVDGRDALYRVKLDETLQEELVAARTDVDIDSLVQIGRRERIVGMTYVLEKRKWKYFAPDIESMLASLSHALPNTLLEVIDSSVDEQTMLVFARTDRDPGVYYIFDRAAHQLNTFVVAFGQLEGVTLAAQKAVTYPAADGTMIPAYLTLPPGKESARGLPAIVMPHGGPADRDEWGFDWMPQYFASRGFAVLQPNFRGSSGYGEAWFKKNGFRSWQIAVGDVLDAGRWLTHEGIADPAKLAIVGWSYGGYAALQSAVVDGSVFKAVVAVAPVTDLQQLKEESRYWSSFDLVSAEVGDGAHMREGSPAEHADRITVPVILFHGEMDRNVNIEQSRRMAAKLKAAGGKVELVTWDDLDHQLNDSEAREKMLRKSDEFLRQTLGMQTTPVVAGQPQPPPAVR